MMQLSVIGNLGADAELHREQGYEFIALSIAATRRIKQADGTYKENTDWVSATVNGPNVNILPYLTRGTTVFVSGEMTLRLFHSEKQRRMMAGVNLFVRHIELVGARPDLVPRDVYDTDGVAHRLEKLFYAPTLRSCIVNGRRNDLYQVDNLGFVTPYLPQGGGTLNPGGPVDSVEGDTQQQEGFQMSNAESDGEDNNA